MRTTQRDQTGYVTFSLRINDAASGSGIAAPGIPFTFTRASVGRYDIRFDAGLTALTVTGAGDGGAQIVTVGPSGPGAGGVTVYTFVGGALANASLWVTIAARDRR